MQSCYIRINQIKNDKYYKKLLSYSIGIILSLKCDNCRYAGYVVSILKKKKQKQWCAWISVVFALHDSRFDCFLILIKIITFLEERYTVLILIGYATRLSFQLELFSWNNFITYNFETSKHIFNDFPIFPILNPIPQYDSYIHSFHPHWTLIYHRINCLCKCKHCMETKINHYKKGVLSSALPNDHFCEFQWSFSQKS